MKKTWKQLLGTLANGAAIGTLALGTLLGPAFGQEEDDGVVVLGRGAPQPVVAPQPTSEEGAVRLGGSSIHPASANAMPSGPPMIEGSPGSGFVVDDPTIHPGGAYDPNDFAPYTPGSAVGYAVTQDPEDILFRVGRRNGDIYGIKEGFTSLGAYLTRNEDSNTVWFLNPRLLLTDQGRGGLNLGFGQKAFYPELNRVISLSAWWDFDSGHATDYHQVGLSFEMLGEYMSIRSNANFVVSRDEHLFGASNLGAPIVTDDGFMIQRQSIFNEVAYNQADVEIAAPLPFGGDYGWEGALGTYFLFGGDGRDATGVKGRIEAQINEDLWVNAMITSDRVFDRNVSVNLEYTIPHAMPAKWFRPSTVRDKLWSTVRRQYRVATDVVATTREVPIMVDNGGGMQQLRVGLIDPNLTNDPLLAFGGSGTSDDPWLSIADYTDEDLATQQMFGIIAVRSRNDDTDTNLNTTIVLLNGQSLFGEGVQHSLDGFGITPIEVPSLQTSGVPLPRLSNSDAPGVDVVTLANNTQVSGFNIDAGGTARGVVGDGVSGFIVTQNNITNAIDGIRIRSLGAPGGSVGVIRQNMIDGAIVDTGAAGLGSTRGISIEHEAGLLNLLVADNTVSNFQGEDANANGMLDFSEDINNNGVLDPGEDLDSDGRLDLSEDLNLNGALDAGFGIYIAATGGSTIMANDPLSETAPLGLLRNTLTANGSGMSVTASGASTIIADIQDNMAIGSTDLGEDANQNGILDFGEDINGNGALDFGSGINIFSNGSTIGLTSYINNVTSQGAGNGATFQTLGGGTIGVVNPNIDPDTLLPGIAFTGNNFDGNTLDGMFVRADTGSIIFDQIESSTFIGNGDDGLDLETDNGGTIFVRDPLLGNTFTGNGDNGIEVTGGIGGGVIITIGDPTGGSANVITGNGVDPLALNGAGIFLGTVGGTLNATFSGLTSTGNAGSGALIFLDGGTITIDGGVQNNTFTDNGEHGLAIVNNNGGTFITPFVSDNIFNDNGLAGLFLGGSGPGNGLGTTSLTDLGSVTRNEFNRTIRGTEGILIDASDQRIRATLTQNDFIGRVAMGADPGAGRGIGGEISGTTTAPAVGGLTLGIGTVVPEDQNTFTNNGDAHIGLVMSGNTSNMIDIRNGVFADAFDDPSTPEFGGEGVHYILEDTATLTGQVDDSTFTNNEGDGLLIEIIGNNDLGNGPLLGAAQLNGFRITDSTFTSNGFDASGATIGSSNGISISREARGQYNDLFIANNLVEQNSLNGIMLRSIGVNQLNLPNMRADTVMVLSNTVRNNGEDGIEFVIGADADVAARLDGNLVTMNGFDINGNNNTGRGNGIEVRELVQDQKDSRSLTGLWTNNVVTNNFDDGIDLSGYLGNQITDLAEAGNGYTVAPLPPGTQLPTLGEVTEWGLVIGDLEFNPIGIINDQGNLISDNASDGIDITAGGNVTIANNIIVRNGTTEVFGPGDVGFAVEVARHAGINIDAAELNAGKGRAIGEFFTGRDPRTFPNDDFDLTRVAFREVIAFSNLISENNGDGVELLTQTSLEYVDSATNDGSLVSSSFSNAEETRLMLAQNEITRNTHRGVDILQRTGGSDPLDRDNEDPDGVVSNINSGFTAADVSIIGNHIKENGWEGVYIVQTVDDVQNQVSPSDVTIDANGNTISNFESLRAQGDDSDKYDFIALRLDIHDNDIFANGEEVVDFPATGLVIRVGTSGLLGTGFGGANFFATTGFNMEDQMDPADIDGDGIVAEPDGLLDNDLDGDGFLDAAQVNGLFGTGSGISASITGNEFEGNFGDDILFHSFTATVNPDDVLGGAFNGMEFTPMGTYEADPLARFDLIFSLNRFSSIEPNNVERTVGTSPGNNVAGLNNNPGAPRPDAGAFYDLADPIFNSQNGMNGGFFDPNGVRQRNATRFASNYVTGPFPLSPGTDNFVFLYPGMGNSTFRVIGQNNFYTDQGLGAVDIDQVFIFDAPELFGNTDLVDAITEANGVFPSLPPVGGTGFGELPWGWDILEPGTPFATPFDPPVAPGP